MVDDGQVKEKQNFLPPAVVFSGWLWCGLVCPENYSFHCIFIMTFTMIYERSTCYHKINENKHKHTFDLGENRFIASSPWATWQQALSISKCLYMAKVIWHSTPHLPQQMRAVISADETMWDFLAPVLSYVKSHKIPSNGSSAAINRSWEKRITRFFLLPLSPAGRIRPRRVGM